MGLTKKERKQLIEKISQSSGVAQYALQEKMTDEQVIQASEHLKILALLKDANNFNRYRQGLKTREANEKLKAFLDPQQSEILTAGKWLLNALSRSGEDRKQTLLERELVHRDDYNSTVQGMRDEFADIQDVSTELTTEAKTRILSLQRRIDTLRNQLSNIQDYICFNYSQREWKEIKAKFNID